MCRGFFFQAEDGIRDYKVTGVQTCALPICAVFLRDTTGAGPALAAIGYFAFSGAMASGRLAGDGLMLRFGPRTLVRGGATLGAAGLAAALLTRTPVTAVAGRAPPSARPSPPRPCPSPPP